MQPYVPIPMVAKVDLRGIIMGQRCQNTTYWLHKTDEWTAPMLSHLAGGMMQWWLDSARTWLPAGYQFLECYATAQFSATGPAATTTPDTAWIGLRNTGGMMPSSVTLAMAFRSGLRGRGNVGRNYWPGFARGDVVDNEIALGACEGIKDAYSLLMGDVIYPNAVAQWVVVSRRFQKAWRAVGTHAVVTEVVYSDRTIDSQRRRLPRRGD